MRLKIITKVDQDYLSVKSGFDEKLFKALNPPFPKVKLSRFDGCKEGDIVSLRLNFIFFSLTWESLITEDETTDNEFRFVDEGTSLPFFLKFWRHHHRVVSDGEGSLIIDDITFKTPFYLPEFLMYPALYGQFLYRKPIYQKFFKRK